jgi:hypothetical protein
MHYCCLHSRLWGLPSRCLVTTTSLYCCASEHAYRAIAWQRFGQIRYNTFAANLHIWRKSSPSALVCQTSRCSWQHCCFVVVSNFSPESSYPAVSVVSSVPPHKFQNIIATFSSETSVATFDGVEILTKYHSYEILKPHTITIFSKCLRTISDYFHLSTRRRSRVRFPTTSLDIFQFT